MTFMDKLAKLDSTIQRGLDNSMAAVFGGKLVPAEIEELVKQDAQDAISVGDNGDVVAPNVYAVGVSSKDLENLSQDAQLPNALAEQLMRFARNQGWRLDGPPVVRIAEESGLRTGQLRVSSYIDAEPEVSSGFDAIFADPEPRPRHRAEAQKQEDDMSEPTSTPPTQDTESGGQSTVSLLLQDGSSRTYMLHEGSNILGRSNEADFRLPDTGVSRQHAEITWDGEVAVLVDLQSTNGTTVNDEAVENWMLADGDVITVGHSHIEVRIIGPGAPLQAQGPTAGASDAAAGYHDGSAHPSTELFEP